MQIWAFTDIQKRAKIIEFLSLTPFIFGSTQPQFCRHLMVETHTRRIKIHRQFNIPSELRNEMTF